MLYGLVPNTVRSAYISGVPPVESTFFRTSIVAVCFSLAVIARGENFRVPAAAWPSLVGQTASTLVVSVGYLASVQFIPVGLAAIIFFTFPVLIMLAAPLVEGHKPGWIRTLIACLAFAGLAVSVGPSFETLDVRGILLAAAASVFCAMQFFSGRQLSQHMTPMAFGSLVHLMIWPATLAIALLASNGTIQLFPGGTGTATGLALVAGGGAIYLVAYLIHMLSLRFASASIVAPFFNLEPIVATVVAALFLGERLAPNQYVGGGMVLAALVISRRLAAHQNG